MTTAVGTTEVGTTAVRTTAVRTTTASDEMNAILQVRSMLSDIGLRLQTSRSGAKARLFDFPPL